MSGLFDKTMDNLTTTIKNILLKNHNAIIAIDGCCASGKTTLAARLAEDFGLQIIHMDDFFLLPEMRTKERLSAAGGNIHYERFNDEVAAGITSGTEFEYRVFSCRTGNYSGTVKIDPALPVIIEGAYSVHPDIKINYDLKIFLETDTQTQLKRIEKRNGADAVEVFKSKWIPLENLYFETFDIKNKCDIKITA